MPDVIDYCRAVGEDPDSTDWDIKRCDLQAIAEYYDELLSENVLLRKGVDHLEVWIEDLQSGMYVNCVYCGYRYGPRKFTPETMADVLKEHIELCPDHPMSKLKVECEILKAQLDCARQELRS